MTNKNKQKRTQEAKNAQEQKKQALKEKAETAKSLEPAPEIKAEGFSKGQLNAIMLIGVGITKLMSIGKAIRLSEEPTKTCTQYFRDDSYCSDDGLNVLLRFKYMLSIQVLVTVVAVVLQLWQSDEVLVRYGGSLLASPVFATVFTLVLNDAVFDQKTVWTRDVLVAMVLTYVTMPAKDQMPFLSGKKQPNNTFQSFALMTFCAFSLFDLGDWVATIFQSGAQGMSETLFTSEFLSSIQQDDDSSANMSTAWMAVAQFFLIDKLTIAVTLFFAWFYLKESHHRVSTVHHVECFLRYSCALPIDMFDAWLLTAVGVVVVVTIRRFSWLSQPSRLVLRITNTHCWNLPC